MTFWDLGTTSVQAVTPFSCHIHLQWGKRPHGEGFSPVLLIYQGSEHKLRRKQGCFIQINYVPEKENVEKQHLAWRRADNSSPVVQAGAVYPSPEQEWDHCPQVRNQLLGLGGKCCQNPLPVSGD